MAPETRRKRRTNLFTNDLSSLLFAYGDVAYPNADTVAALEDIVQEYITSICYEAYRVARAAHRQKLKVDDFKFALRHDAKKLGRVEELLALQKEITEARKQFDDSEAKNVSKDFQNGTDVTEAGPKRAKDGDGDGERDAETEAEGELEQPPEASKQGSSSKSSKGQTKSQGKSQKTKKVKAEPKE